MIKKWIEKTMVSMKRFLIGCTQNSGECFGEYLGDKLETMRTLCIRML